MSIIHAIFTIILMSKALLVLIGESMDNTVRISANRMVEYSMPSTMLCSFNRGFVVRIVPRKDHLPS